MALSFVAVSSATTVASGDITLTEPTGAAQNDLLVACISARDLALFTLPSGWTIVASQQILGNTSTTTSTSIASGLMAYIVRGASAPSYAFTRTLGDVAFGCVICYRGPAGATIAYDTGTANTLLTNSATVTTGTLTTAVNNELLVMAGCYADNTTGSAYVAATNPTPTGFWTERVDSNTTTGADTGLAIADSIMLTAGATGTLQYTAGNSSQHVCIVGAFKHTPAGIVVTRPTPVVFRQDTNQTAALTTASFTPPNSCLLVAIAGNDRSGGAATGVAFSGGSLTWTIRQTVTGVSGSLYERLDIATAQVGTAASMTVSIDQTTDNDSVHLNVFAVTGQHSTSPIGAGGTAGSPTDLTTGAVTLSAAPAATSVVFHARMIGINSGSGTTATPGADFWELSDTDASGYSLLASQMRFGSTSTSCVFVKIMDAAVDEGATLAAALEIKTARIAAPSLVFPHDSNQHLIAR